MLNGGFPLKGRWKVIKKIGAGAFGEIFNGVDLVTKEQVAIKAERCDAKKQVLKLEVAVLKKLQGETQHVCRFVYAGRLSEYNYNYLVMELLSDNLSELRRKQPDGKFSVATTVKLGKQMIHAIHQVHKVGYLHRDVKPSNFGMGMGAKKDILVIIDFGLARRYRLPTGEIRPPRDSAGFRGTARYASIHSHQGKELSRRDDLWSVLYVMVEFLKGNLPWRKVKEKEQIGELKMQHHNSNLVKDMPREFLTFMQYLDTLRYEDEPNYDYLSSLLQDAYDRAGYDESTPYDWDLPTSGKPTTAAASSAASGAAAAVAGAIVGGDGSTPPRGDSPASNAAFDSEMDRVVASSIGPGSIRSDWKSESLRILEDGEIGDPVRSRATSRGAARRSKLKANAQALADTQQQIASVPEEGGAAPIPGDEAAGGPAAGDEAGSDRSKPYGHRRRTRSQQGNSLLRDAQRHSMEQQQDAFGNAGASVPVYQSDYRSDARRSSAVAPPPPQAATVVVMNAKDGKTVEIDPDKIQNHRGESRCCVIS